VPIIASKVERGAADFAFNQSGVGLIQVRVFREMYGTKGGATAASSSGFIKRSIEVPEKSIKGEAKSHGTAFAPPFILQSRQCANARGSLGAARRVKRGDVWRAPKKDGENFPIAVYKFHYRSRGICSPSSQSIYIPHIQAWLRMYEPDRMELLANLLFQKH